MDLQDLFSSLWRESKVPPDVFAFLSEHDVSSPDHAVAILLMDQQHRWQGDSPLKVEDYLAGLPWLANSRDCLLRMAIGEFQNRRNGDASTSIEEFTSRFPAIREALENELRDATLSDDDQTECAETCTHISDASIVSHRIGRYRLLRVLGEGAFGRVYLGFDDQLHRQVAIKVPNAERFKKRHDADTFLAEARAVASLDHPHIVPVYDIGRTDDGSIYTVSKFIEGQTLRLRIRDARLDHVEAAELLTTIALALQHAHDRRLIHRDVKPGNILIEGDSGTAYLADFGLAIGEDEYSRIGAIVGTPSYMSPEQARGEGHRLDGRSDVFSLGIVLYELLTGRKPFRGSTGNEILHQIVSIDPPPPRQLDHAVPAELERICLKAMSKQRSDRYATAGVMAEDLLHWQERMGQDNRAGLSAAIISRGLRPFEAEDADFFLELLPGPRNCDGLPESIRFWKKRIEETDPDETFSVGLIYGPSGCGKSSLVRAGLLPRLEPEIVSVYIEATAEGTEDRVLRSLRKRLRGELPNNLGLVESLTWLRRNARRKVVVILDQFEQWLHGHPVEIDLELINGLRQCDGGVVQFIVMVRDDFAMAAARFMDCLDVPIVQGRNFATVDLFDVEHARKLLIKFGQAFGKLPPRPSDLTAEQQYFISTAASGLAQDGKVVTVRLVLFAEMVKGKPWVPATLKEVGGTEGVGLNFLEEAFGSRAANPHHRKHFAASREILKAMLPDIGTDIKGNMQSYAELLRVSGHQNRPEAFNDLLRILDGELRLITPTDPEGLQSDSGSDPGSKCYQLTHDYLVPSLRAWLTQKQSETRRGRAELLLRARASLWNKQPESRHLPSMLECASIGLLTRRDTWTATQRRMMRAAGRFWGGRAGIVAVVGTLTFIGAMMWLARVNARSIAAQVTTAVDAMQNAQGASVEYAISNLEELPNNLVLTELEARFQSAEKHAKLPIAYAMAHFGDTRLDYLTRQVEHLSPSEAGNLIAALRRSPNQATRGIRVVAESIDSNNWNHQARLAIVALFLGEPSLAARMCQPRPNRTPETVFISELSRFHAQLFDFPKVLEECEDAALRSAICLAIGAAVVDDVQGERLMAVYEPTITNLLHEPNRGIHSAARWALLRRTGKQTITGDTRRLVKDKSSQWFVNTAGVTMMQVPSGVLSVQRPTARIFRVSSFWISDREISVGLYRAFLEDASYPARDKPETSDAPNHQMSPTIEHPIQNLTFAESLLFCNWLSQKDGLAPVYVRSEREWSVNPNATGYRIPTEVEWEYAYRANSNTRFSFGDEATQLDRYAVFRSFTAEACGSRMPNAWGLFDMHGNVWEWCHKSDGGAGGRIAVDEVGRILCGGSFLDDERALGARGRNRTAAPRLHSAGFRVVLYRDGRQRDG